MEIPKHILGLDLGPTSVGWASVDPITHQIIASGSRIIPMDADSLADYDKGTLKSAAAQRTVYRRIRTTNERAKMRRYRLLRVLHLMGFLPKHFSEQIDFEKRLGQFKNNSEPLLAYRVNAQEKKEFLFIPSFEEMLGEFRSAHPELVADGKKVPYDWTLYYLRKKALTRPVSKEELAWILLSFNTKRGYFKVRGLKEKPVEDKKQEEYCALTVVKVEKGELIKGKKPQYEYAITYDNGQTEIRKAMEAPYYVGQQFEAICTIKTDKKGNTQYSTREPKDDDWTLIKKKTEQNIRLSGKTVGAYIYDEILAMPSVKVRGKLVHTIDRKYYRQEMEKILRTQQAFHPELLDAYLLRRCAKELYRSTERQEYVEQLVEQGFIHFLTDDIVFYQRPLKSKTSEIANCPMENNNDDNKSTNEIDDTAIKCIPKSHPLFQEYRLWQFINNLRILEKEANVDGSLKLNHDVTEDFLDTMEVRGELFDYLYGFEEISEDKLLAFKPFKLNKKTDRPRYRWNYPSENTYPCNKSLYAIPKAYRKYFNQELWDILYSAEDFDQVESGLRAFAEEHDIEAVDEFVQTLAPIIFPEEGYGAYSEKALKKLLPLMRCGKYWNADAIDTEIAERIQLFLNTPEDKNISDGARKALASCHSVEDFQALPSYAACYAVYNRDSETSDLSVWKKPEDIAHFRSHVFKQHSLRNPVVERVVLETLRVVEDVWRKYGKIDEIHVEMGRNLKQDAEGRKRDVQRNKDNEAANFRARLLLQEFASHEKDIEEIHPHSPYHQSLLRIYEEEALGKAREEIKNDESLKELINKISNPMQVSKVSAADIRRYRIWLDQKCQSPYTGRPIPLARLFTPDYEIEHIIPRSRYYNDSMNNKVICESQVNKVKDNMTGYEFIKQYQGMSVEGGEHKVFTILNPEEYEELVHTNFEHNRTKMYNLLMDEIPTEFSERMLNDTRYMSRAVLSLLSKVVREQDEVTPVSKHVISTNGSITSLLKSDWGINDVWNELITPRFQRMNQLTNSEAFGEMRNKSGKRFFQPRLPLDIPQIDKKRIDHRHHAMDAIVIACTTRNHITYLNTVSSHKEENAVRKDLRTKLCFKHKTDADGNYKWLFRKPWDTFTQDVRTSLEGIVVSFKQDLRVLTTTQQGGTSIRKPLHKETYFGLVSLQKVETVSLEKALANWHQIKDKALRKEIKRLLAEVYPSGDAKQLVEHFEQLNYTFDGKNVAKVEVYTYSGENKSYVATRKELTSKLTLEQIESITDSGIRQILMRHLENYQDASGKYKTEKAFSPEGLAHMNAHIRELNGGKPHQPIYKARFSDAKGTKFAVGTKGVKAKQFVVTAEGTNIFTAVYEDKKGKRSFVTIPLRETIDRLKKKEPIAPSVNEKGELLLFFLSLGDLVYVPEKKGVIPQVLDIKHIYKLVSASKGDYCFAPQTFASPIYAGNEYPKEYEKGHKFKAKKEFLDRCVKLKVNRLGEIEEIIGGL